MNSAVPSVLTIPGLIELTRIFHNPSSRDKTPVIASTAALEAVYTTVSGRVIRLEIDPILIMLPPSPRCLTAA